VRADANEVPTQCRRVNMEWNWISPRWKQRKGSFDILGVAETVFFLELSNLRHFFVQGLRGKNFRTCLRLPIIANVGNFMMHSNFSERQGSETCPSLN
jgi:hypothetical protein